MRGESEVSLFDRLMGMAVVVLAWALVICIVLSMGRCTYDVVVGNKADALPTSLFQPR